MKFYDIDTGILQVRNNNLNYMKTEFVLCQNFFPGLHTLRYRLLTLLDFWETDPSNDWK